jgi:chemotaxis signal transduction protein
MNAASTMLPLDAKQFVLFPLGKKRFALPAENVIELARPDVLHRFPHTTPLLDGVLLRRGRVVPVLDIARVLIGDGAPKGRFYLMATGAFEADATQWTAVPVMGECEMMAAVPTAAPSTLPAYVSALLSLGDEIVEVLDLRVISALGAAA